jgi:hypothetical protein
MKSLLNEFIWSDSDLKSIKYLESEQILKLQIEDYVKKIYTFVFSGVSEVIIKDPVYFIKSTEYQEDPFWILELFDDDALCLKVKYKNVNKIEHLGEGHFTRDASDRFIFEIFDEDASTYKKWCKAIINEFNVKPIGIKISTFDEIFQDYIIGINKIGIEWDNWSGLIIVDKSCNSEKLIRKIAKFIILKRKDNV